MALPSSGTITWEMIRAEFGGGYPIYMSQYYRGGGLVPNTAANAAIPTSGPIYASHFYGASATTLTISVPTFTISTYNSYVPPPTQTISTSSSVNFQTNGSITHSNGSTSWGSPNATGLGNGYEIFATNAGSSGTITSSAGTFGSWLPLSTIRSWSISTSSSTSVNGTRNIQFQIRPVGGSVIATGTITLNTTLERVL